MIVKVFEANEKPDGSIERISYKKSLQPSGFRAGEGREAL
jgi:hypothetical protein